MICRHGKPRRAAAGTVVVVLMGMVSGFASADPLAQMRQCRQLTDVALKAACYDAIALPAAGSAAAGATAPNAAAPLSATVATGAAAIRPAAPAPVNAPAVAARAFGLPSTVPSPTPAGAVVGGALESSIPGQFEGWQAQTRIRLANGQLWQVTDGSEGAYSRRDPKVRISRGSLGSFFMQIEGVAQTPRVRRVE